MTMTITRSPLLFKAPTALILPPPVLHQRYAIDCEIGKGGCARVFQAWDTHTTRFVAMKRAHLGEKSARMLQREAEILSGLRHPGVPEFLDYFEEAGRCYLVEEWRSGTPMSGMRYFSLPKVLWIGRQCCDVLTYLHSCELFHGDLAPGNVLLADSLTLIDFGIASWHDDPPRPKGTPGYAAPEQWNDGRCSAASDIFSLGMLLGCALTDSEPEEVQRARSFRNLWDDPGRLPAKLLPLLTLLDRMIAPTPTARPGLAEVQDTLLSLSPEQNLVLSQR